MLTTAFSWKPHPGSSRFDRGERTDPDLLPNLPIYEGREVLLCANGRPPRAPELKKWGTKKRPALHTNAPTSTSFGPARAQVNTNKDMRPKSCVSICDGGGGTASVLPSKPTPPKIAASNVCMYKEGLKLKLVFRLKVWVDRGTARGFIRVHGLAGCRWSRFAAGEICEGAASRMRT